MYTRNSSKQKGFGIAEIVLSLAIFLIIMSAIFQYSGSLYRGLNNSDDSASESVFPQGLDMFRYGETVCDIENNIQIQSSIDLSTVLSTSTYVTSIHDLGNDFFIITSDSASTTEPDIFRIKVNEDHVDVLESKDVGPGIQDSIVMFPFLYIANTSTNSHVKVLRIDTAFTELQNIRIPTLSLSGSMPRELSIFGHLLMLGTEKSNTSGELFSLPIGDDGLLGSTTHVLELNGQAHTSRVFATRLITANSADPELRVFDYGLVQVDVYDAPLTLGNGKDALVIYPYVILGRTLGSEELTVLDFSTSTIQVVDTDRTNGTVDALQQVSSKTFFTLTSNAQKEIQFWNVDSGKFNFVSSVNLPDRTTAHTCVGDVLYIGTMINEKPFLLILK